MPITLPNSGLFIAIEGGDGSGKSTIITSMIGHLIKQNQPYTVFREPGGTDFSEDIREVFFKHHDLSPETSIHVMNAQRQHNFEKIILPALKQNHIVIADRFTASTLVYQGILQGKYETVNHLMLDIPAFNVMVDTPPEIAIKRIKDNNRETNRFDDMSMDKHLAVYAGYKSLSTLKPDQYWGHIIDGSQSKRHVDQQVEDLVNTFIQKLA